MNSILSARFWLSIGVVIFLISCDKATAGPTLNEDPILQILVPALVELDNIKDISLLDIVKLEVSPDERKSSSIRQRLKGVRLGGTDQGTLIFSQLAIQMAIEEAMNKPDPVGLDYRLKVPSRVQVVSKTLTYSEKSVREALSAEVSRRCPTCRLEIADMRLPDIQPIDIKKWEVRLGSEIPKGNFSIPLYYVDSSSVARSSWVTGRALLFNRVAVLKQAKSVGDGISSDDISLEEKEITFLSETPAQIRDLELSVTARPIEGNQILMKSMLKKDWAIRFGENVKLHTVAPGIEVLVDGIAQEHAFIGGPIKIKIPGTKKTVTGKVVRKGEVEVRL